MRGCREPAWSHGMPDAAPPSPDLDPLDPIPVDTMTVASASKEVRAASAARVGQTGPAWLPAALLALGSIVASAWLVLQPKASSYDLLVVFAPWWSLEDVFRAAAGSGAAVVRPGPWPFSLIVRVPDKEGRTAIEAAGAWLLLDPRKIDACIPSTKESS